MKNWWRKSYVWSHEHLKLKVDTLNRFLWSPLRKSSPQTESRENPPNLEKEETTETVVIPHDDEKENETQGLFKHNYSL